MSKTFRASIGYPFRFVLLMWCFYFVQVYIYPPLNYFGIVPRSLYGLTGIFFAPLLHGNFLHLVSNSIPLLVLGTLLYLFYNPIAPRVFAYCYVVTGILVWIFGREAMHIGASGLVYGIAFFLFFIGISQRDFRSLAISLITVFFYGGIIYGVLPSNSFVSWESHLMGAMVGIYCAFNFTHHKKKNNVSR